MFRRRYTLGILLIVAIVGLVSGSQSDWFLLRWRIPSAVRQTLENADQLELLSVQTLLPLGKGMVKIPPVGAFHDYPVLGSTRITDASARQKLVAAFYRGATAKTEAARCFNPRHGIRATGEGRTVDLLICFECGQVRAYVAGEMTASFRIARSPQPLLDQILRDAGVPLPSPAQK
jgi:hypothetical protein